MQFARRQDGQFQVNPSKKSVNHVPSKAFQMLQKQYSEEQGWFTCLFSFVYFCRVRSLRCSNIIFLRIVQ